MTRRIHVVVILISAILSCSRTQSDTSIDGLKILHEEIKTVTGKTFVIYSSFIKEDYIKHAVVIQKGDERKKVYFEIDSKIVKDKNGKILIDGSDYGAEFYAWRLEVLEGDLYVCPYWDSGKSTTDPIIFVFNNEKDRFEKLKIDESEY